MTLLKLRGQPFLKRRRALSRAFSSSSSRSRGGAAVDSEAIRVRATAATSSTALAKATALAFDGVLKPLSFRTNCRDAAQISSSVAGGSKLNSVLMLRHKVYSPAIWSTRQFVGLTRSRANHRLADISAILFQCLFSVVWPGMLKVATITSDSFRKRTSYPNIPPRSPPSEIVVRLTRRSDDAFWKSSFGKYNLRAENREDEPSFFRHGQSGQ